ncbi:hypothetical protein [Spartinivicinus ruber]|nr:hypothetical protein [Spartinivicinus ruber]
MRWLKLVNQLSDKFWLEASEESALLMIHTSIEGLIATGISAFEHEKMY